MFSFVETKLFTRLVAEYLTESEYIALQETLEANPEAGKVVAESGGVRKLPGLPRVAARAAVTGSSTSYSVSRASS